MPNKKDNNIMSTFSKATSSDVIEQFVRKAHVERSLAVWAMSHKAFDGVKKIFSRKDAVDTACCAHQ